MPSKRQDRRRKRNAALDEQGVPDEYQPFRPNKEDGRDQISLNFMLALFPARVMNRLVRR